MSPNVRNAFSLAIVWVFLFLAMAKSEALAGEGYQLLRIEGYTPEVVLDDVSVVPGELIELKYGDHYITLSGNYYARLALTLRASASGITIAQSSVTEECGNFPSEGYLLFEVKSWTTELIPDQRYNNTTILLVQGPSFAPRTKEVRACSEACCGWAEHKSLQLAVHSLPQEAMILVDGELVAATDATISIPYGVSRDTTTEDVLVRVVRTGYIGCTWHLRELMKEGQTSVSCTLKQPEARGRRP